MNRSSVQFRPSALQLQIKKLFTVLKNIILSSLVISNALFAKEKHNVVIVYGDDVGYGDIGVNGSTKIPTPHIDRIARQGLLFTDGHCTAATCTPSRYSMLTGLYGFRKGVRILPPNAPLCICLLYTSPSPRD